MRNLTPLHCCRAMTALQATRRNQPCRKTYRQTLDDFLRPVPVSTVHACNCLQQVLPSRHTTTLVHHFEIQILHLGLRCSSQSELTAGGESVKVPSKSKTTPLSNGLAIFARGPIFRRAARRGILASATPAWMAWKRHCGQTGLELATAASAHAR